jgi:signal transduction histidine kinase
MLAGAREHSVFHTLDLKSALALAVALEGAPIGLLMLHDNLTGHLYPALLHGAADMQCTSFGLHRPGIGPIGLAFSKRRVVTVNESSPLDDEIRGIMNNCRCPYLSIVPLFTDPSPAIGVLVLMRKRPRATAAGPLMLLYASVLATALDNLHRRDVAEHAREQAEVRSRAKSQFFARLGHELRTPVQSVIGYLDLMQIETSEPLPARHRDLLGRAVRSGEAILNVIEDLINFSRVEAGRVTCNMCRTSLADGIAAAELIVAPIAASRQVALQVELPKKEFVRADVTKLRQILVNLLVNAVKFTPSGGSVTVHATRDKPRGQWLDISVTDTGRGIASNKLGQIFEPFVQLGIPSLDGLGGSGLGLPISREFAMAMGGDIAASSNGHGSTFTLRLQRDRATRMRRAVASA